MGNMNGNVFNYTADGAIPPRRIVKYGATDGSRALAADPGAKLAGITTDVGAGAAGDRIDVQEDGECLLQVGASVEAGEWLTSDAQGRGIPSAEGGAVIAAAKESGEENEIIRVNMARFAKEGGGGGGGGGGSASGNVFSYTADHAIPPMRITRFMADTEVRGLAQGCYHKLAGISTGAGAATTGDRIDVQEDGECLLILGGYVDVGDWITSDIFGRGVTLPSQSNVAVIAQAKERGNENDIVKVTITRFLKP